MVKKFMSVEVSTDTMQIFRNGEEIKLPHDIYAAYRVMCTHEYLMENYTNDEEVLWKIASMVREHMDEAEGNGYPVCEDESIDYISRRENIKLMERRN